MPFVMGLPVIVRMDGEFGPKCPNNARIQPNVQVARLGVKANVVAGIRQGTRPLGARKRLPQFLDSVTGTK